MTGTTDEAARAGRPVLAAIDIGSNTIKLSVATLAPDGGLIWLGRAAETVRLGAGVEQRGALAADRIDAALATLGRFAARAHNLGASTILAVATEATRRASNGAEFLDRVRRETGIAVRTISGDEEAALTFRGLAATTDVSGRVVIADIGGGSTELIVAEQGAMQGASSLRLGSGTLTDRALPSDPAGPAAVVAAIGAAGAVLDGAPAAFSAVDGQPAPRLIIVGGTGEYLDRLANGPLTPTVVERVLARLATVPAADIAAELAIAEARARVLPAGVAIVRALVDRLQPAAIGTAPSGIRAGLLLDAFAAARQDGGQVAKTSSG